MGRKPIAMTPLFCYPAEWLLDIFGHTSTSPHRPYTFKIETGNENSWWWQAMNPLPYLIALGVIAILGLVLR